MKAFMKNIKWQIILLHKNNIITISFSVTVVYGLVLYFLKDIEHIDQVLIALVLNDPSVIGYFFIALAIYTEIKQGVLNVWFVIPINIHSLILTKVISISMVGVVCSLGLAISVKGMNFDIISYSIGSMIICTQAALLGLITLTFSDEFLSFSLRSIPVFFLFTGISLLNYLGVIHLGYWKYFFPVQGSLDLINSSLDSMNSFPWYSVLITVIWTFGFYAFANRLFPKNIIHK